MPTDAIVVGAGGFGRETLDVIEAHNTAHPEDAIKVLGIADDGPSTLNLSRLDARGYRYLGSIDDVIGDHRCDRYLLAVGNPAVKPILDQKLTAAGWRPFGVTHPAAVLGTQLRRDEGVIVCGGVQVSTNVTLGRHTHLNPNCTVGHDTRLADYVSVNPGGIVSGDVTVGAATLVGAGAVILQGLTIGEGSIVGAGSVVTKNIPSRVVVKGVPGGWS